MILSLNELMAIYPEQIWIDISPEEREKAWQQTQHQRYSNAASRWNAYLNCLCLNTFTLWIQEEPDLQETLKFWPSEVSLPSFWDVVNGTKLTLGETELVLIPTDKSAFSEFRIPQEWVDIPGWASHYYLAANLNLEAGWMRVCGYATREQIKKKGRCGHEVWRQPDRTDRTYVLDPEDLIADLNVMWVARELFPAKKLAVNPLPTLSKEQTDKILQQLSQQIDYSPRLDLPFEQWASLIANDENRQKLYQLRLAKQNIVPNQLTATNLSLWLHNIFEVGWQSVDTILGAQRETLAFQFRTNAALNDVSVKGLKLIDLGMDLKGNAVMLLVGLTPEIDEKVNIRVQLYPAKGETYLPPNLKLGLLSPSGVTLQEVESRSQDNYIQLKRFKSPAGKGFSIQVTLGDVSIKEDFVLSSLIT
jgi:Protein of unknown function (DUF1822)